MSLFYYLIYHMTVSPNRFLASHFLIPLFSLAILSIAIELGDVDRLMADYFYAIQGNSWAWKDSWLTEVFFHKGGRSASIVLALISLVLLGLSFFNLTLAAHKKPLLYLFLATAGSSLLIGFLKSSLAISCPWEFDRYGGQLGYSSAVEQLLIRNGAGCFPAGHASAGYAWISSYFFGLYYQSRWRWVGLGASMIAGAVFGFVQQIRGAHFISHDLWTLAICWFFSLALFLFFFKEKSKNRSTWN